MTEVLDFMRRMTQDAGMMATAFDILLRVTVLLLVAMLIILGWRRSSAALRHLVWALSLAGTLLVPLCYWGFRDAGGPHPSTRTGESAPGLPTTARGGRRLQAARRRPLTR